MSNQTENSYHKLAKTPLATDTKICGREPKVLAIIIGFLLILIDVIPTIALAIYILGGRKPEIDFFDKKHSFEERTAHHTNIPRIISAGIGILFAVVHLVGIIVLLIGAITNNTHCYYCWVCSMCCNIFMGKLAFAFSTFIFEAYLAGIVFIMVLLDIPLFMLMFIALGKTAGIARNKRYLSGIASATYEFKPGTYNSPGRLLPPGSYPQQQSV